MFIEKELYKNILRNVPIPTVDILFVNQKGKILLGKRNNEPLKGIHYIPGGRVNKGERSHDAAKRKAKEELGIDIETERLCFLGVYDDIFENSAFEDVSTHCISVLYTYSLNHDEEELFFISDLQHSELQYFSLDDASLHDMVKIRLKDLQERET